MKIKRVKRVTFKKLERKPRVGPSTAHNLRYSSNKLNTDCLLSPPSLLIDDKRFLKKKNHINYKYQKFTMKFESKRCGLLCLCQSDGGGDIGYKDRSCAGACATGGHLGGPGCDICEMKGVVQNDGGAKQRQEQE